MLDINILGAEHKTPNEQENLNKKTELITKKQWRIFIFLHTPHLMTNQF